ncbi:MAG TPA: lycopene cyclase family protein [Syntrophorhabdaceae bacterium]|nr:lycopene cyclase family protein [Syntrophorhabdaceae bacterium]
MNRLDNSFDIVIVGAGIAGMAAAREIVNEDNLSLAIIEANGVGSNNPSPLTFADIVEKHGFEDCLKARYRSFVFHNYQGSSIQYTFDGYPLVVLDYRKACEKLHAILEAGCRRPTIITQRAVSLAQNKDPLVILENGDSITAKIIIDCSGKSQLAHSPEDGVVRYYSHVYGGLFSGLSNVDDKTACFLWPQQQFGLGGGWFYPLNGARASFGYATISTSPEIDIGVIEENFQEALHRFSPYSDYLAGVRLESIEYGTIPITPARNLVQGRVIAAGDAAGMATSWTCMGVEPALRYGTLAGKIAGRALTEDNYLILRTFQDTWNSADKARYDDFARIAGSFWNGNREFWEWIIRNDLAFLSAPQVLDRMRNNDHVPKKHQILFRALRHKLRMLFSVGRASNPAHIAVSQ